MDKIKIIREALEFSRERLLEEGLTGTAEWTANALTALAELETSMQSVSERSVDIPIEQPTAKIEYVTIEKTEYDNLVNNHEQIMRYQTDPNYDLRYIQGQDDLLAAGYIKPTANEELIKEIERFRNCIPKKHPNQHICPDTISGRFAMMQMEIDSLNKELSQVKPSIWKKYPDEKPNVFGHYIVYRPAYLDRKIKEEWFTGDKFTPFGSNAELYWCYEADLIKTIGE